MGYQRVCLRCDSLSSYSAACWCWLWGAEQQEDVEEQRRPSVAGWSLSQVRYVAGSACGGAVLSKSPPLAPMLCFEAHQPTSLVKAADREGKGRLLCPLGNTASCCTLRPNFVLLYCSADLDFDERLSNGKPWLINIYTHYVRPGSVASRPPGLLANSGLGKWLLGVGPSPPVIALLPCSVHSLTGTASLRSVFLCPPAAAAPTPLPPPSRCACSHAVPAVPAVPGHSRAGARL